MSVEAVPCFFVASRRLTAVKYEVKFANGIWSCTCGAWIFQKLAPAQRKQCHHIAEVLADLS